MPIYEECVVTLQDGTKQIYENQDIAILATEDEPGVKIFEHVIKTVTFLGIRGVSAETDLQPRSNVDEMKDYIKEIKQEVKDRVKLIKQGVNV